MKILIVGAGAVGGYYGGRLALVGEDVTFLARGEILEALNKQALKVKSYQGDFQVSVQAVGDVKGLPSPELIILAVKTYDTDKALRQIESVVGDGTLFMSLQNGVESEEKMASRFGKDKVLGAVCYIGSEVTRPGEIMHSADGQITVGEFDGSLSPRLERIVGAFRQARIDISTSENIRKVLWEKLLWNVPFNQVCAIARASVGEVLDSKEMCELLKGAMEEVIRIAQKHGVVLDERDIQRHLDFSNQKLRLVRPSMLQDLEKGKHLEHETFSGFLLREGKRLDISVPINETFYRFLCFLDPGARVG